MSLAPNQFIHIRHGYHGTYFRLVEYIDFSDQRSTVKEYIIERKRLGDKKEIGLRVYTVCQVISELWRLAEKRRTERGVDELVQVAFEANGGKGAAGSRIMRPTRLGRPHKKK